MSSLDNFMIDVQINNVGFNTRLFEGKVRYRSALGATLRRFAYQSPSLRDVCLKVQRNIAKTKRDYGSAV